MVNRRRAGASWLRAALGALLLGVAGTSSVAQSPEEIFNQGNEHYDAGRYDGAAEAYRKLLRYQIEDPRVEYNLGNAEFRRGNLGLAILHFERARRLDPTDPDTLDNLIYARSLRVDKVPEPERNAVLQAVRIAQERLGPDRQAWMLLALGWLIGGLLAWGLAVPGRWHAGFGWSLAALLLLGALLAGSWYLTSDRLRGRRIAVVLEQQVEVLAGPGENNATLATIHEGLDVEVWGERADWIQVRLPNGISGWIASDAAEVV